MSAHVLVIGAGLAGSEAAWFLANRGVRVTLFESKRVKPNPAQKSHHFAELVCTNSLKSKLEHSAHGILKHEMSHLDSLVLASAYENSVPAGDALAVDRDKFSAFITDRLKKHPLITCRDQDVNNPVKVMKNNSVDYTVIATGPLTSDGMSQWLKKNVFQDDLYFYDAIAPVVDADSLDYSKLYFKDRYKDRLQEQDADYLNSALSEEQYYHFIEELVAASKVSAKDFEEYHFFESCLPIDIMAERGYDTARFSCMKPVGLEREDGCRPFAAVQLRRENLLGSAYNMVGFQTRLTYPEQKRVFRLLPGFEKADFIHLGSVHRNTFLNAKKHLAWDMSLQELPQIYFAGQITGVEGYTESAASGLYVASQLLKKIQGKDALHWPVTTAIGALINYIMTADRPTPSNINFGLLPSIALTKEQRRSKGRKRLKKQLVAERARRDFDTFWEKADR